MAYKAKMMGRDAVMRKLNTLVPEAERELAQAQMEAAQELAAAIKARAPRRTGHYADSIKAGPLYGRNDNEKPIGLQLTKDKNAWGIFAWFTWRFLEFGTKAHAARAPRRNRNYRRTYVLTRAYRAHAATRAFPHIFPTYRAMRKKIRRRMAMAVNKAVRKVASK